MADERVDGRRSGAPEAGGATTHGSLFGGRTLRAHALRLVARWARFVEAACYRMLRDLDQTSGEPEDAPGRPQRVREAFREVTRTPNPA